MPQLFLCYGYFLSVEYGMGLFRIVNMNLVNLQYLQSQASYSKVNVTRHS